MAKKEYVKPILTRNEPLVDITFATPTPGTGTLSITGGSPGTLAGKAAGGPDVGGPDYSGTLTGAGGTLTGTGMDDYGTGGGTLTSTGTLIPGTGGAPGTIL
jgi:hypothetical protein